MTEPRWTTYQALLADEAAVRDKHLRQFPGLEGRVARYVDVLLRVLDAVPPNDDTSSPDGVFHGFAWQRYAVIPYSIRSLLLLLERGHYDSCVLLVRHLLEIFVQIRYFVTRRDKVSGHWHNTNPVPFRPMLTDLYAVSIRDLEAELAHVEKSSPQAAGAMAVLRPIVE